MPKIFPFTGYIPSADCAQAVVAPPYDVVSRDDLKKYAQDSLSLLNVTRPEGQLDEHMPFNDPRVYQQALQSWQKLVSDGVMQPAFMPCFYIYEMTNHHSEQVGVIALVDIHDCENNIIRRHELTRPDKENDRREHILTVEGQLSPVLLTTKDDGKIEQFLRAQTRREPSIQATLDGVTHKLWLLTDTVLQNTLQEHFMREPLLYIADGHHRTAAALRAFKEAPPEHPVHEHPFCLAAIFPEKQMHIQGYHRMVDDLNGHTPEDFLKALKSYFEITPLAYLSLPQEQGYIHMQLGDKAYALKRNDKKPSDPIAALDVSYLQTHVLESLLNIQDVRTDARIHFVGGGDALETIASQVKSNQAAVGFLMYPTQMQQLMAVADAEQLMPPKSTWFEPKVADGLVCYSFKQV